MSSSRATRSRFRAILAHRGPKGAGDGAYRFFGNETGEPDDLPIGRPLAAASLSEDVLAEAGIPEPRPIDWNGRPSFGE